MQGRGLKLALMLLIVRPARSPLVQGRGLKQLLPIHPSPLQVAPRAGAWIETRYSRLKYTKSPVAPRAGAWIETCLLYTSDAADDLLCVDLGGRRIIKKKNKKMKIKTILI